MGEAKRRLEAVQSTVEEHWPHEVQLDPAERLWLMNVLLPKESDHITLRLVREMQEQLSFSDEEITAWKIVSNPMGMNWDKKVAVDKNISFGRVLWEAVVNKLNELSRAKKLSLQCLSLYEKFIGEPQP